MSAAELSAPESNRGKLQRKLLAMLRDRERDGLLPTNVRFLFYELVQMAFIAKQRQSTIPGAKGRRADQDVIDAVFWLRDKALVPWDWIVDETRQLSAWRYAATIADYLADTVELARLDRWAASRRR